MVIIIQIFWKFWFIWEIALKLTRRQEDFIHKLLDLSRELEGPIHYSKLAERLGVSPFTAYDMLRLLEEKGLVTSEYHLAQGKSGPGRAERVFLPTRQAYDTFNRLTEESGTTDWETFKQSVLEKIRAGEIHSWKLAEDMLSRIPLEENGQSRYCVEVMTIIALRLGSGSGSQTLAEYISIILPDKKSANRANLCLLGGLALGLLENEDTVDHEWRQQLIWHVRYYLNTVIKMSVKDCRLLGEHLTKVFAPLTKST